MEKTKKIGVESIKIEELVELEMIQQQAGKGGGVWTSSICKIYITGRNNWMTNTLLSGFNESVTMLVS